MTARLYLIAIAYNVLPNGTIIHGMKQAPDDQIEYEEETIDTIFANYAFARV